MSSSSIQILLSSSAKPFFSLKQKSDINTPFALINIAPSNSEFKLSIQSAGIDLTQVSDSDFFKRFSDHITKYANLGKDYLIDKIKFKDNTKHKKDNFWYCTRTIISSKQFQLLKDRDFSLMDYLNTSFYQLTITFEPSDFRASTDIYHNLSYMLKNSKPIIYSALLSTSDCYAHSEAMLYLRSIKAITSNTDTVKHDAPHSHFSRSDTYLKVLPLNPNVTKVLLIQHLIDSIPLLMSPFSNASFVSSAHIKIMNVGGLEKPNLPDYNLLIKPEFDNEGISCYALLFEDRSCFAVPVAVTPEVDTFKPEIINSLFEPEIHSKPPVIPDLNPDDDDDDDFFNHNNNVTDVDGSETKIESDDSLVKTSTIIPPDVEQIKPISPKPLTFSPSTSKVNVNPDPNPLDKFRQIFSSSLTLDQKEIPVTKDKISKLSITREPFSPYDTDSSDDYSSICERVEKIKFIAPTLQTLVATKQMLSTMNDPASLRLIDELNRNIEVCCVYASK